MLFPLQDGWPNNALLLANVLLSASKSVSESAFGRGLATPQQFVNQVKRSLQKMAAAPTLP